MTLPKINKQEDEHSEIVIAKAAVAGATSGLNSLLLKPNGTIGDSLFMHMVQNFLFNPKVCGHLPISYLDIELNVNQICELGPSGKYLEKQCIMSFAGGNRETMKLEKWNLNSLGYIKSFLEVQNDPDHLRRLTNKLELAQSLY